MNNSAINSSFENTTMTLVPTQIASNSPNIMTYIDRVILPLIILMGVTGNSLSIAVMRTKYFSSTSSALWLIALSFSDSVWLMTQPFSKQYVIHLLGYDVRAFYDPLCKLYFIMHRSAKMVSSWMVVGLCIERFIIVWYPLKAKIIMTRRTVSIMMAVILVVTFTFTGIWSFASKIVKGKCLSDVYDKENKLESYMFGAMLRIGSLAFSITPMVILVCLTPLIIWKLIQVQRNRESLTNRKSSDDNGKITAMLISIVIAYFVLVLPMMIVHNTAYELGINATGHSTSNDIRGFMMFKNIAKFLMQLNFALNFFLYMLTSKKFRDTLFGLFECSKQKFTRNFTTSSRTFQTSMNT